MTGAEKGFLLLTSKLGNPERKVLSAPQLRVLGQRMQNMAKPPVDRELECADLVALGYDEDFARRILALLEEEDLLAHYLKKGRNAGCIPVTRINPLYPQRLIERLGLEAPGCLWMKGNPDILRMRSVSLVGSRELHDSNREFAREVGRQAALQGYALVSGNARGADRAAQNACLEAGGCVISVVADELEKQPGHERILYISEDSFDEGFSAQRALSRNRCIHAWSDKTLVAQCSYEKGGTWDGSVKNLRFGWSELFCYDDESPAVKVLQQMGANTVGIHALRELDCIASDTISFFE